MKQKIYRSFWLKAITTIFFCVLASFVMLLSSFRAQKITDDMWKMLGISKQGGDESIQNSFMYGYLYYYGVKNAKNIALNNRSAIARDLVTYTKSYISGPVFKNNMTICGKIQNHSSHR